MYGSLFHSLQVHSRAVYDLRGPSAPSIITAMALDQCGCSCLQPDPDIAGIGGMISFAVGSAVTINIAVATLLLNLSSSHNKLDIWLSTRLFKRLRNIRGPTANAMSNLILLPILFSSSDSQLLTGFVVLLAGWIQFWNGLSVYHFSVIVNMAWSATNSQLLSFFASQLVQDSHAMGRPEPKEEDCDDELTSGASTPPNTLRFPRRSKPLRASLMLVHAGLLLAATAIQSHGEWYASYQCPVLCVAKRLRPGGSTMRWMIVNYLLLLWGYSAAIIPSFAITSKLAKSIHASISRQLGRLKSTPQPLSFVIRLLTYFGLFVESMTFQIIFPYGWFILGLLDLVVVRYWGKVAFEKCGEDMKAETRWGFGQLVPILYLVAPLLPAIDAFGRYRMLKRYEANRRLSLPQASGSTQTKSSG